MYLVSDNRVKQITAASIPYRISILSIKSAFKYRVLLIHLKNASFKTKVSNNKKPISIDTGF